MHMILPTCLLVMGTPLPRKQFWYLAYAARSLIRDLLVYGRFTRPRREAMSSSHTLFRRVIARRSYHCLTRGLKASRDSTAQRRYVDCPCDIAKNITVFRFTPVFVCRSICGPRTGRRRVNCIRIRVIIPIITNCTSERRANRLQFSAGQRETRGRPCHRAHMLPATSTDGPSSCGPPPTRCDTGN
ncbi:hypothetical protein BD309DRAFT_535666 [Dichomitus squalens]|uniref:Uncharacterized protein n=1 Tax=Dichomitus squalens TaxID=114155 RepID=A0A4V2K566_9APHY|nr:hypothetical protein BD309DRAFT_535666 [Dichomitus squalens]TBU60793.1 hypothetical protein BD310DRAFT_267593 [Dichomitus squalens]